MVSCPKITASFFSYTRYITWPGQALGYKIGQMKIAELRKKAEADLGPKFDLKDFHEVVLLAAGPLEVVEMEVNDYIPVSYTHLTLPTIYTV